MNYRRVLLIIGIVAFAAFPLSIAVAIQLENRDSFCASCHTQPESAYYTRSLTNPSDLASAHAGVTVRCIDCHSGAGIQGRAISLSQGASDLIAYLSGNYQQPAKTHNPVGDQGCTKCHLPLVKNDNNPPEDAIASASHYHLASYLAEWKSRVTDFLSTCVMCHVAHFETADSSKGYIEQRTTNITCDACHRVLSGWIPTE